ncbi:hypothetical protein J6590_028049 [Homalodisca vitripennis]|nr:hypothetical protein J6590_028049 [Homalodisca vitripennis]
MLSPREGYYTTDTIMHHHVGFFCGEYNSTMNVLPAPHSILERRPREQNTVGNEYHSNQALLILDGDKEKIAQLKPATPCPIYWRIIAVKRDGDSLLDCS